MQPKKRKPTHPGEILSEEFLKPQGLSPANFAKKIGKGWSEQKVNDIINGIEPISDKTAEEFASFFNTSSHFWKHLQSFYSQYETTLKHNEKGSIKPWKKAQ